MNKHTKYILSEILDDCGYEFKPCVGYEGILEISRDGIIRKINGKHKVIKSTKILSNGYEQMEIKLYDHNYHRYFNLCEYVHRLVAKTFIKNKNPKKNFVNHKDGNKINNNVKNLEWVDRSENAIHYYKVIKPKEDHT